MNCGGRLQNIIWQSFDKLEKDRKIYARCIYYGILQANHVDRMKSHANQCTGKKYVDAGETILDSKELTTTMFNYPTVSQIDNLIKPSEIVSAPNT